MARELAAGRECDTDRLPDQCGVPLAAVIAESLLPQRKEQLRIDRRPFYGERTANSRVFDDCYHCFGCGAQGDSFRWLMATRRVASAKAARLVEGTDEPAVAGGRL